MALITGWLWVLFNVVVLGLLALDLGVFHRKSHEVTAKEAGIWTVVWVTLALAFNVVIYVWQGAEPALQFLTGYLIEESLSVDNIFIFVMILSFFKVPKQYQHRVLFWGVLGALVLRGLMIGVGAALIAKFSWILYLFGAFLVFTGIKMGLKGDEEVDPDQNPVVKFVRRLMPVTPDYVGDRFLVIKNGKRFATPLLLVLVMIETSDLIFAVDSIPAIFSVTTDPFIVYTSNVFAIMGLRSLYFLLASVVDKFRFLKYGLAVVLTFIGSKMLALMIDVHVPIWLSLTVIVVAIGTSVVASLLIPEQAEAPSEQAKRLPHHG